MTYAGQWFSAGTNKTDRHDITERLLKVELNTINNQSLKKIKRQNAVFIHFSFSSQKVTLFTQ